MILIAPKTLEDVALCGPQHPDQWLRLAGGWSAYAAWVGEGAEVFLVDDMRDDGRWPDYAWHAAARGVGSSLSMPLPFQSATLGAMNNYATQPHAFTEEDVEVATAVAPWVAYVVGNASAAVAAREETANMWAAMATRAAIEQAKGILMERHHLTPDQAFTLLTRASQHTGRKFRGVAQDLGGTGELPPD